MVCYYWKIGYDNLRMHVVTPTRTTKNIAEKQTEKIEWNVFEYSVNPIGGTMEQRIKEEKSQIDHKQQDWRCKLIHSNIYIKCKGTRHSSWKADTVRLDLKKQSCLNSLCGSEIIKWGCMSKLQAQCLVHSACFLSEISELILWVSLSWKLVNELPVGRSQLAIHTASCPPEHSSSCPCGTMWDTWLLFRNKEWPFSFTSSRARLSHKWRDPRS